MAAPQPGYPPQGQPIHDQDQYQQEQYGAEEGQYAENVSPVQGGPPVSSAAARRKRQYAGQAYDFGAGANSALGGQQQGGGGYPGPPGTGYGAPTQQLHQQAYQQPGYGADHAPQAPAMSPGYGQPPAAVGGYQPPESGYPTPGIAPVPTNVGGITQGMNSLGMGGQVQQPPQHIQQRPLLNQLYPTDLLNQPFSVSELDFPPPPIILPPNVSNKIGEN
jgi:protein transport protein SEC24